MKILLWFGIGALAVGVVLLAVFWRTVWDWMCAQPHTTHVVKRDGNWYVDRSETGEPPLTLPYDGDEPVEVGTLHVCGRRCVGLPGQDPVVTEPGDVPAALDVAPLLHGGAAAEVVAGEVQDDTVAVRVGYFVTTSRQLPAGPSMLGLDAGADVFGEETQLIPVIARAAVGRAPVTGLPFDRSLYWLLDQPSIFTDLVEEIHDAGGVTGLTEKFRPYRGEVSR